VLVRFLVGDTVGLVRGACPSCGRNGDRLVGPVTRGGDLVKVKGMLINPAVLLDALDGIAGIEEFQVVVQRSQAADPLSMDELVVRVSASASEDLAAEVVAKAQDAVRVTPRVEFVAPQDAATRTKTARFVDRR
jgi:phenylacetate-coenzyme A ligase PaaK-like adenylate-forming protein